MLNVLNESIVDQNNQNYQNSCNVQQHSLRNNNNVRKRHCSQNEPSMGSSTNDDDNKRSKTMSIGIPKDVGYYNKDKENQANTVQRSVNDKVKTKASKTTKVSIERPAKRREPTGYKTTGLDDHEESVLSRFPKHKLFREAIEQWMHQNVKDDGTYPSCTMERGVVKNVIRTAKLPNQEPHGV